MFILTEVIEREISTPRIHPDLKAAQIDMAALIAAAFNSDANEILDCINESTNDNMEEIEYGYVGPMSAYGERYGQNFDWKIHEIHTNMKKE